MTRIYALFGIVVVALIFEGVGILIAVVLSIVALAYLFLAILERTYYNGENFINLKNDLNESSIKFNELNEHIKELKSCYAGYSSTDYGDADYNDDSVYNYKRPYLSQIGNNTSNEYYCSLSVCRNAQNQPFKYLCKYFNIPIDENTLNIFEAMLNDFSAAEEGKQILLQEREEIIEKNKNNIPFIIRKFRLNKFFEKLGQTPVDTDNSYFPKYTFKYISPGGNSSMKCDIELDLDNLERFVEFLYSQIQLKKTMRYQRALMTEHLRDIIKKRDNYTCQMCGISIEQEPHLLLEIDHIIPISKNGETTMNNLQTLCWRCNRLKGNKLIN